MLNYVRLGTINELNRNFGEIEQRLIRQKSLSCFSFSFNLQPRSQGLLRFQDGDWARIRPWDTLAK